MLKTSAIDDFSQLNIPDRLAQFDARAFQYGTYFAGFRWDLYGCLTHSRPMGARAAEPVLQRYFERLGKSIRSQVAYVAVPERRTSGCGMPAIPLHWHFLAAGPERHRSQLLKNARVLAWKLGQSKIDLYDPALHGAPYIAKLASQQNFDWVMKNLDHMLYTGSEDLYEAAQSSEYFPPHALNSVQPTLVLRQHDEPIPLLKNSAQSRTNLASVKGDTPKDFPGEVRALAGRASSQPSEICLLISFEPTR